MARLFYSWLAVAVRVVTLWMFLAPDLDTWILRAASGLYWMSRQDDPDFVEIQALRDEADRARDAWSRGEVSSDDARNLASIVADRLRRWSERTSHTVSLFTSEEVFSNDQECRPFDKYEERFALLESEDSRIPRVRYCNYLVFLF
jgi:hypothetical protein